MNYKKDEEEKPSRPLIVRKRKIDLSSMSLGQIKKWFVKHKVKQEKLDRKSREALNSHIRFRHRIHAEMLQENKKKKHNRRKNEIAKKSRRVNRPKK